MVTIIESSLAQIYREHIYRYRNTKIIQIVIWMQTANLQTVIFLRIHLSKSLRKLGKSCT